MPATDILIVDPFNKIYHSAGKALNVLHNVSFTVTSGSTMAITGPSGSGKTTLLGICAGLDNPTSGTVKLNGIYLNELDEDGKAAVRNRYIGFIFQNFQLLATLTALENVMVPMELRGIKNCQSQAMALLDKVGLASRAHHYPVQLSGGEQQRVSIARAFSNQPAILFADEPTGNLDAETSDKIQNLLFDLNKDAGTTLIIVTHDLDLAARTHRIIQIATPEVKN